jgi:predicted ferric reductase
MFDRLLRVLRTIKINRGAYHEQSHAGIVYTVSQDSVKLILPNRHLTWNAGQHVYLTLPGVSTIPFESHPFTIANIPERKENGEPLGKASDLVFYIRAMDGFTRKLYDYAHAHQGKSVVALVDGPYGKPPPVNTFSTVVLIAGMLFFIFSGDKNILTYYPIGGSGSSFTVPLLLDILS